MMSVKQRITNSRTSILLAIVETIAVGLFFVYLIYIIVLSQTDIEPILSSVQLFLLLLFVCFLLAADMITREELKRRESDQKSS